jgi:hypothetical protein
MSEKLSATIKDRNLQIAWIKMLNYDLQAIDARKSFRHTRIGLIVITTLSTIAASWATFFVDNSRGPFFIGLAFIALSFPIFGNAMINYIQRFENITIWLKHRMIAERMRSEIFQYRMGAGKYAVDEHKRDNLLNHEIHEAEKVVTMDEVKASKYQDHLQNEWRNIIFSRDGDYGEELSFEEYFRIRCVDQKMWYNNRIHRNYSNMKKLTMLALAIQVCGAVFTGFALLSGIGDPRWIIASNAVGFAINSFVNVEMTGQLYGLFDVVQKELSKHEGEWYSYANDPEFATPAGQQTLQLEMIEKIEKTLAWERDEWYRVALQTLSSNDQALFKAVEELHQRNGSDNDTTKV